MSLRKYAWIVVVVFACAYLARIDWIRIQRTEYVSALAGRAETSDIFDPSSPTGYAHGQRELIIAERNEATLHWVEQTQLMLTRHEGRIRHVDYDNAPEGHDVNLPSPYRWCLGASAWIDHTSTGKPMGYAVERATLYIDPLFQLLFLISLSVLVARSFGSLAAMLFSLGFVGIYPLAAQYFPGQADESGLVDGLVLLGLVVFMIGLQEEHRNSSRGDLDRVQTGPRFFILAGVIQGISLWIGLSIGVPLLAGLFLGGLFVELSQRASSDQHVLIKIPWRPWAWSGALTVLVAYFIEYFPGRILSWNIESIHPLYGLAWIGLGELLAQLAALPAVRGNASRRKGFARSAMAALLILPVPLLMAKTATRGFLGVPLAALRLSKIPASPVAEHTWRWILQEGGTVSVFTTIAPLCLLGLALFLALRRSREDSRRSLLLLLLGPALIAVGYAARELAWWEVVDVLGLATIVAISADAPPRFSIINRVVQSGFFLIVVAGAIYAWPNAGSQAGANLNQSEAELLMERDLAHWIFRRAGSEPAVVFAGPHQSLTQSYFGGLRGVGTFGADNRVGFGATIAIASATTMEEARALLAKHEVKFIVIPSWDHFFENYPHLFLDQRFAHWTPFFIPELRQWHLPLWLRAIPYDPPKIGGLEDQSVLIFEVVDEQTPVVAASRLAEYYVETGNLLQAQAADTALRRFPGDIGALAARAQIASARDDESGVSEILKSLAPRLESGADRYLPWDRRVSLAIVLARAQSPLAPAQVKRCIDEITFKRARFLSTGSLYNLLLIAKTYEYTIADRALQKWSEAILETELGQGGSLITNSPAGPN